MENKLINVLIKQNKQNSSLCDIYVKDENLKTHIFFITLQDVYINHYHCAEYHQDILYVIHRTGGNMGYENKSEWTDSLWCYDKKNRARKVYTAKGLDFRVSKNNKIIAIADKFKNNSPKLILINKKRLTKHTFNLKRLKINSFRFEQIDNDYLWLKNNIINSTFNKLIRINCNNFKINFYNIPDLISNDFTFNTANGKILYSNYPTFFESNSVNAFKKAQTKVVLKLFDIYSQNDYTVATIKGEKFQPKWINNNTIEFNDVSPDARRRKRLYNR